jgi:hypothetical protein
MTPDVPDEVDINIGNFKKRFTTSKASLVIKALGYEPEGCGFEPQ